MHPAHGSVRIGVLGGGQLGRMLIQAGLNLNIDFSILDPDPEAPCKNLGAFTCGKLTDYDTILAFANNCDVVTIEIENVNTDALKALESKGKKVFPQPSIIQLIQDKRKQKQFLVDNNFPTAEFVLVNNREDIKVHQHLLPAVNKLGREGYDGRGVQMIRSEKEISNGFDQPGLLERLIEFEKEISVIVARNKQGEVSVYDVTEMIFHPEKNLVEYLFAPAKISESIRSDATNLAKGVIAKLAMVGLLAIEMFVTKEGKILINEMAPRPHNSGHHTIEACVTSQYEQHLRAILNWPLGDASLIIPSAMVNLLGEEGYKGLAKYIGLEEVLKMSGVHVHLYGKKETKPFRKMGHVTITDSNSESLLRKTKKVKETLKIIA